ncbi:TNF receptor-associated factor 3 [Erpetoichthys calabaricus]|nr:TNF receptor-associated factor 3 [Erpetoichthys calabaricus]XP_028678123.1 TNF receptor-associated factor 3 [Erpetoichthys calabaricus]XP_028678124.1 TNF receptor-associated factor 3 [Erpetoichthys calabaricus]XP_051775861.1 TNF receptor-associated factor 3 [Erpetoichthys calabaricus]XP_051775862.1 TNF receptor-associated factor 3 [Erpetoichthys calabaricus]
MSGRNVEVPQELQIPVQQRSSPSQPSLPNRITPLWPDQSLSSPSFLPPHGGFRDYFVLPLEPKYCCESCHLALCNPKQTECGHRFCESCVRDLLREATPTCPVDGGPLFEDKIFKDVCCGREIMGLRVFCRNERNGCKEQMTLQQLLEHLQDCPYYELPCPRAECKEKLLRKDVPDHLAKRCKYRDTICPHCKKTVLLADLKKHEETVCPAFPVSCPNKCSYPSVLRSELTSHQHECPNAQVNCMFSRYGCSFKGLNQELKLHEATCMAEHLRLMLAGNFTLEKKMEDIKSELHERYLVLPSLNSRVTEIENRYEELRDKTKQMEQKISNIQKLLSSHSEKMREMDAELRLLRQTKDEVDALKNTVEAIRNRVAVLEGGSRGNFAPVPHTLESLVSRHDDMLSVHEIRLADMDLRFQVLETASYNGTLIWKIRDYKRRKQEAVAGKTLSLYSQPFYTGYFGYKMCARVYLNGDGMGKGTHLSLFFVVMRGEYDALLTWPFKQKVTLMLMDQGPARKHLCDAFKPDPNSSSFKRPVGDMNIASGCPLFVSQPVLENGSYIKDDTIFIKVVVDTSDLPDP